MVFSHTHLTGSNPAEGQVVVDELNEITLTYDGNIEKLSSMKVLKDGSEMPAVQVQIEAHKMVGILQEQLENGAYTIQWNIAGEDGHPITGESHFTVQREEMSEEQGAAVPDQGQGTSETSEEDSGEVLVTANGDEKNNEADIQATNNPTEEKGSSNTTTIIIIIGLVIILGIGLLLIRKKKL
jgi:copper resistance protein C